MEQKKWIEQWKLKQWKLKQWSQEQRVVFAVGSSRQKRPRSPQLLLFDCFDCLPLPVTPSC